MVGCAPGSYCRKQKRIQRLGAEENLEVHLFSSPFFVNKATETL